MRKNGAAIRISAYRKIRKRSIDLNVALKIKWFSFIGSNLGRGQ